MPHVEINGVGYSLAEDAEGEHYSHTAEPLRPPNAVTVQGESRQKFQMRPDTLLWSLTDWSGGAGQIKFDQGNPNRWRELEGVRVFERPGTLSPGWSTEVLLDSAAAELAVDGPMVAGGFNPNLYLLDDGGPNIYQWTTAGDYDPVVNLTGPAAGASRQAAADATHVYWHETGTDNVWKWPMSGTTATQIDSGGMGNSDEAYVCQLGAYVYVYLPLVGEIWEIAKAGGSEVLIDDFSENPGRDLAGNSAIVPMGGKIYVLVDYSTHTAVREITPTSAAGTGFGVEIATFEGLNTAAMWAHSGTLYLVGRFRNPDDLTIVYLTPGGTYGSLGRVPISSYTSFGNASPQNGDMLSHFFLLSDSTTHRLFEIDAVSGGFAVIAEIATTNGSGQGVLLKQHGFLWPSDTAGAGERSYRADPDGYAEDSYVISPWHDFDLADEKILSSLVLSCEDLPADWTVYVDYAINNEDSWTNLITYSTDNGNGTKQAASTDSSTVKFRTVSVRIRMEYTGVSDPPTSGPVILGVDVLAMVAKPTNVWRLILDLSDDKSRGAKSFSGYQKRENIMTASATEAVVSFKDYYGSHKPGRSDEYDVIIDQYSLVLSSPGEGVAVVTLKEVA